MQKTTATFIFLMLSFSGFCQTLAIQAIFYDADSITYKIEQKYINEDRSILYVSHFNNGSACVKKNIYIIGDTTVEQETTYDIFHQQTRLEEIKDSCIGIKEITYDNNDSATLVFLGEEKTLSGTTFTKLFDTTLTKENASELQGNWRTGARVARFLKKELVFNLDSLIPLETTKAYFVNNTLVKVDVYNGNNKKQMQ